MLIVFEGVNGCGKTTIIDNLISRMNIDSYKIYKFPNRNTKYGKILNDYLTKKIVITSKYDIINLFALNRLEFIDSILNDLKNGINVICDRYYYSGMVYQIPENIRHIKYYYHILKYFDKDMPKPDIVFLVNGNFLKLRNECAELYHTIDDITINKLFDKFRKIINCDNVNNIIIDNEYDNLPIVITRILAILNIIEK